MIATLKRVFASQEMVLLLSLLALFVIVGSINPRYVAERNLYSIFLGNAYIAVAAIGMSMVIISGNIDISVGSLIGVLATLSGTLAVSGYPILVCWLAPLIAGALVAAFMGFLVAYFRIPSIVVTLGMLSILKGGLISVTGGKWISELPARIPFSADEAAGRTDADLFHDYSYHSSGAMDEIQCCRAFDLCRWW